MKKNEKGFSAVEALVVLLIITLIGAVGWLVYDRQKTNSSTDSIKQQETADVQDSECVPYSSDNYRAAQADNWVRQEWNGLEFQHPSDWAVEDMGQFLVIKSPDSKTQNLTQTYKYETGAQIRVHTPAAGTEHINADNYSTSGQKPSGVNDLKTLVINCNDVIQYDEVPNINPTRTSELFTEKGLSKVMIEYAEVSKESVLKVYDQVLETIIYN